MGEVHAGVLPLNRANLAAAGPPLEAERHVIVVPLGPGSGFTAASCMRCRTGSSTRAALHSEHLQNPMMDGNGELHTCHRTSHIEDTSTLNLI